MMLDLKDIPQHVILHQYGWEGLFTQHQPWKEVKAWIT